MRFLTITLGWSIIEYLFIAQIVVYLGGTRGVRSLIGFGGHLSQEWTE